MNARTEVRDPSTRRLIVVLACTAWLASCSILVGIGDKQCSANDDCTRANLGDICVDHVCVDRAVEQHPGTCDTDNQCGGESPRCMRGTCVSTSIAERWLCPEDKKPLDVPTVNYSFKVVEFLTRQAPKDIVAKACRFNDVGCAEPVATYTDTDGKGLATFAVPTGFLGYFEVHSDAVTSLLYVTKPINKDLRSRDLPVLSASTLALTASFIGYTFDTAKGLAILEAIDCSTLPAGGVQFKEGQGSPNQFYVVDQVPTREASTTVYNEADDTADGGFINLNPGPVKFSAYLGEDGPMLGSFNAQIRSNTITFVDMSF
jgi:hypothetical protein